MLGPMMGYGLGGWGWMMALNALFWLLLVVFIVAVVARSSREPRSTRSDQRPRGLDLLEERYARGELARDEFLQKKQDMLGGGLA